MKILKPLVLLSLLAFAAYSGFWYWKSNEIEKSFKTNFDLLSKSGEGDFELSYDSIDKGGFPYEVNLIINNPKLKAIPSSEEGSQSPASIKTDGQLIHRYTVNGDLKGIEWAGKTDFFLPGKKEEDDFHFRTDGDLSIASESGHLVPQEAVQNFATADQLLKYLWDHLNLNNVSLQLKDYSVSDVKKDVDIFDVDDFSFNFSDKAAGDLRQIVKAETEWKGWYSNRLPSYFSKPKEQTELMNRLINAFTIALYSQLGRSDGGMDLDLDIPNDEELVKIFNRSAFEYLMAPLPEGKLDMKGFAEMNKFGHSTFSGSLALKNQPKGGETFSIAGRGQTTTSHEYVSAIRYAIKESAKAIEGVQPEGHLESILKDLLTHHVDQLVELVPQMDVLSPIDQVLDWNIELSREKMNARSKLTQLAFLSQLFGFQMNGEFEGRMGSVSGNLTVDLLKYETMVKEVFGYLNRVIHVLNLSQEFKDKFTLQPLPASLESDLLTFLREISNHPGETGQDLHITAIYGPSQVKVGTLTGEEFAQKLSVFRNQIKEELKPLLPEATKKVEEPKQAELLVP